MKKHIKIIMILFSLFCFGINNSLAVDMIQIKGSDTLINVAQKLSEEYMNKNSSAKIAVTGGGSGTGIAAITNGKCDIANASRLMKPKEIAEAASRGIIVKRVVVAIDGLSVIVNLNNPVTKLTVEEIGKIFRGEITNWSQLGGENAPISLYGRQSNSGTYEFLREFILKGEYSSKMKRMNGNAQILEGVKQDKTGIGYVGAGYLKTAQGINVVDVAMRAGGEYVSPRDKENIYSGRYPIARPLNQYISSTAGQKVRDFIAYELSPEGQQVVEDEGFFKLSQEYVDFNKKSVGL
ncbi:Phosphate binding protein [Candidatus Omnitrophus magneticus]|uniref:Phosphate-binding protein n=1 Tax=Candidatus Omnitrophus magneticus TaxID=1609969 RepID=A0A0F0CS94_9BACT|nr:Phosphate binding protein [Candidatus Omnitrophus magneticus]